MVRVFLLLFALLSASVAPYARAEVPACAAHLYADEALVRHLPERIRPILDSAFFRRFVAKQDASWTKFHSAMDSAFANIGATHTARLGDLETLVSFKRTKKGDLQLWIDVLAIRNVPLPANSAGGLQFLNFIAAELEWIAKMRVAGKLEDGVTIIGHDVQSARLVDSLLELGFVRGGKIGPKCYVFRTIGGLAGFAAGKIYFEAADGDAENGSIYEEQRKLYRDLAFGTAAGAGAVVALACFKKTGRNYSIEFKPGELPNHPDRLPPGDVPPIDLPSPPDVAIWPPKPRLPALPAPVSK